MMSEKDAATQEQEASAWMLKYGEANGIYPANFDWCIPHLLVAYTSALRSELAAAQHMVEWWKGQHVSGVELLAAAQKERDQLKGVYDLFCETHSLTMDFANVSDECPLCAADTRTEAAQKEVERLQLLQHSQAESIGGYISLVQAAKNAGISFSWDGPIAVAHNESEQREQTMRQALEPVAQNLLHIAAEVARGVYMPSLEKCRTIGDARLEVDGYDERRARLAHKLKCQLGAILALLHREEPHV